MKSSWSATSCLLLLFTISVRAASFDLYEHSNGRLTPPGQLAFSESGPAPYRTESEKSPFTAFLVAFFPGFVIRGLGHHYADQHLVGFGLLGAEISGYYLFAKNVNEHGRDHNTLSYVGVGLILGSWVFDFVRSPALVTQQNKRLNPKMGIAPRLEVNPFDSEAKLSLTYSW